jgi:hypothetical protein
LREADDNPRWRVPSVVAALAVTVAVAAALLANPVLGPELTEALPATADLLTRDFASARGLLSEAFARSPVIVLALAAALLLPVLSLLIAASKTVWRWRAQRLSDSRLTPSLQESECPWPAEGFLAVDMCGAAPIRIGTGLIRIGRQDDNDIRLAADAVHRYHAIAYRTMEAHFFIADVSGDEANMMRVNGAHQEKARLSDGDRIEIGGERLTFVARPL